jgi:hypothetical protein
MDCVSLGAYTLVMPKEIQIHRPSIEIRMNAKGYAICDGPARVGC